jgi:hypothetical protein
VDQRDPRTGQQDDERDGRGAPEAETMHRDPLDGDGARTLAVDADARKSSWSRTGVKARHLVDRSVRARRVVLPNTA